MCPTLSSWSTLLSCLSQTMRSAVRIYPIWKMKREQEHMSCMTWNKKKEPLLSVDGPAGPIMCCYGLLFLLLLYIATWCCVICSIEMNPKKHIKPKHAIRLWCGLVSYTTSISQSQSGNKNVYFLAWRVKSVKSRCCMCEQLRLKLKLLSQLHISMV